MAKKISRIALSVLVLLLTACAGGFFALWLDNSAILARDSTAEQPPVVQKIVAEDATVDSWIAATVGAAVVGVSNRTLDIGIGGGEQVVEAGQGSGVIIDPRGYIVTNAHVIAGSQSIAVTLSDHSVYEAALVGRDTRTDLALLKIEGEDFPVAALGDSDALVVGEKAVAIGNPGGLDFANSVTAGIVSGLDRPLVTAEGIRYKLIQTDAAINPGNSGGALVNGEGEVVGINTVKISEAGFEGMGFAIPANLVREVVSALLETGRVVRPALGLYLLRTVDAELERSFHLGSGYGVLVSVQEGGPAGLAGVREYDIIVAMDGERVDDMYDFQDMIFAHAVGDTVTLTVNRDGETQEIAVTLGELKENDENSDPGDR